MSLPQKFNLEYVNTDGATFFGVQEYCAVHYCYADRTQFYTDQEPCRSYREGKCMVYEMLKERECTEQFWEI